MRAIDSMVGILKLHVDMDVITRGRLRIVDAMAVA